MWPGRSHSKVWHARAVKMQNESVLIIIMGCDDVQLVECLPGMQEAVGVRVHTCNLSTGDVEARRSETQGHSGLHGESEFSLD